ncbi:MAG: hypothetical protein A3F84_23960 [Candidatus Handelsmanbacteria bacterium RIFCSPLOWO2_12_FULL_64_10]|uniref:Uncharacterized protein n=1 Tax=Handelsmanbacteria sp. (strain RIFCSPLOWO2_12_FULL_64_10) TaxID=1817868 RepID=A0A1F6CJF3_HANXR|nr:MAG: hypothetical protein A3F84_23960 [Candidatus Handelsmanbacteria bacterium RIFCSPLOWO2_12_FULL_64_10]
MDGVALQISAIAVLSPVLLVAGILGLVRPRPGKGRVRRSVSPRKAPKCRPAVPARKRETSIVGVRKDPALKRVVIEQEEAALSNPPQEAPAQTPPPLPPPEPLEAKNTDAVLQMDDFIARQRERLRAKEMFMPLTGEEAERLYPQTEADRALMEEMLRAMMGDAGDGMPDSSKPQARLLEGPEVWWSQAV